MNGGRRPNQGRGTANKHEQGAGNTLTYLDWVPFRYTIYIITYT